MMLWSTEHEDYIYRILEGWRAVESQRVFGGRVPFVETRTGEGRPVVLAAPLSVNCRYCHRAYDLSEVQICASCAAHVCELCGGTVSNPTGAGNVCIACLRATVEFRERWHRYGSAFGDTRG